MAQRKIIHVDMDCFYAAVEMRDRPDLRGKPIAVGGPPDRRGVLATSNYEARAFGVRSAMTSLKALRLCPELIIIHPDFAKYKRESEKVRAIFERFTDKIEPLSLDEAYLDVSESSHHAGSATRIAEEIRSMIRTELCLTASAGVAPNKFLAKVASDINKPDGIKVIRPQDVEAFVKTLPVEKIWGVGKVTAKKFHSLGIRTCGDLQAYSVSELTQYFGSWGVKLYDYARGLDDRPVEEDRERKSLSVEETYDHDLASLEECQSKIPELYDDWNERMVRAGLADRIRGIYVKLKFHDFQSTTHEMTFSGYPNPGDFLPLLDEAFLRRGAPVRLIGLGVRLEATEKRPSVTPQLQFVLQVDESKSSK